MITIEEFKGIKVLRDDLLPGGTKSILMDSIIGDKEEYVYASPVYGGFQIALSSYCKQVGKKATIFCAKRKNKHSNTKKCLELGANVIEVPYGYLSVIEKRARDYCYGKNNSQKLVFGAKEDSNIDLIAKRTKEVINYLGYEPEEIWCAIGSGTLVKGIIKGTSKSIINGVQVGAEYKESHERLNKLIYHKSFDKESKEKTPFNSTPNYDLKALEYCLKYKKTNNVLFWNVL